MDGENSITMERIQHNGENSIINGENSTQWREFVHNGENFDAQWRGLITQGKEFDQHVFDLMYFE